MARTTNGRLTGRAAATELAEQRSALLEIMLDEQKKNREQRNADLRAKTLEVCDAIRDATTQEEYTAWWETTTDNNLKFYDEACDKLLEVYGYGQQNTTCRDCRLYHTASCFVGSEITCQHYQQRDDNYAGHYIYGGEVFEASATTTNRNIPF